MAAKTLKTAARCGQNREMAWNPFITGKLGEMAGGGQYYINGHSEMAKPRDEK